MEEKNTPIIANDNIPLQWENRWGQLLKSIEEKIDSQAVQEQVEVTTGAVIYGLLPWKYLNPAGEIERLMKLREPANDDQTKKAA